MIDNKTYVENSLSREPDKTYAAVRARIEAAPTGMRLIHGAMGIAGESGELVDAIKKHVFYGKPLDVENVKEELGDILWYMSILMDEVGSSFEDIMTRNDDKLGKRFPKGYSNEAAIARADKAE